MTREQAAQLVAVLLAAHPTSRIPAETVRLYQLRLSELLDYDVALDAVGDVIDGSPYFPKVAEIKQAYRARLRLQEPEEKLPSPTPEERKRMLAEMRRYQSQIGRPIPDA